MYLPEEPHQSFIAIATAGPRQHRSNILTAGETMSIAISCAGTASSYAELRTNATPNERAISKIILSAPLHKMTIIYLQELRVLLIDTNESMITFPGAFKTPHPLQFWDYPKPPCHSYPHPLAFGTVLQWGRQKPAFWDITSMKTNKLHSQANISKWKQIPKLLVLQYLARWCITYLLGVSLIS